MKNKTSTLELNNYLISKGFKLLGFGTSRIVYVKNDIVIKVPISFEHIRSNYLEAELYKASVKRKLISNFDPSCFIYVAKCKPIELLGIPCLIMEKVLPISDELEDEIRDKYQWPTNCNDSAQVGFTSKGRLVCYDYGYSRFWASKPVKEKFESFKKHCVYEDFNLLLNEILKIKYSHIEFNIMPRNSESKIKLDRSYSSEGMPEEGFLERNFENYSGKLNDFLKKGELLVENFI